VKAVLAVLAALACAAAASATHSPVSPQALEAYATARSYSAGQVATIRLLGDTRGVRVTVRRAGAERANALPSHELLGGPALPLRVRLAPHEARVQLEGLESGLYFARVDGRAGHAFAPFVVRPRALGAHRVAVVLPTNTWQAYNFRDANGDGVGDTWYADPRLTVSLDRPFMDDGAPPHYAQYDALFLRWLVRTGKRVDYLSDDDLERVTGGHELAHAYDLVVFSGHHEYVTRHEYDVVRRYRDLGGNLLFLSANNFFYDVVRSGDTLRRIGRWRDLGRPEAALVGVQYLDWNHDTWGNGPYVARTSGWPFAGTGLHAGSRFGTYGIEIDAPTRSSPRNLRILATVPNLFGPGRSATMSYYTTPQGAKVFAAGTINFGGTALWRPVPRILENVWDVLARP
jgi:N,N-dimethylformamidase